MAIGDKWRKWEASSERFQVIRQRHPRIISAEQQAAKAERGARLAKLKADRLDRIQARFDRQAAIVAKREAEREAARAVQAAKRAERAELKRLAKLKEAEDRQRMRDEWARLYNPER
jgi:hypothetical protein